jgi:hypothetical protein
VNKESARLFTIAHWAWIKRQKEKFAQQERSLPDTFF